MEPCASITSTGLGQDAVLFRIDEAAHAGHFNNPAAPETNLPSLLNRE